MPRITFVEHNGTEHEVEAGAGTTLMRAAVDNLVPGIDGDCGGMCACATCHVYLPREYRSLTGQPEELEQGMIEFAFDVDERSRLSCQIEVTDDMEGMRVLMPRRQY